MGELERVMEAVCANTKESRDMLTEVYGAHALQGKWRGWLECHVANAGDWLVVWKVEGGCAYFARTGTHDEIFRNR